MKTRLLYSALAVTVAFTPGMPWAHADETSSVAPPEVLLKTALDRFQGQEVEILRLEFAPGWVGSRHYHPGELFVYILDGAIIVNIAGQPPRTVEQGGVIRELPGQVMSAANASASKPLKILVVHLAGAGDPLLIEAE